MPPYNARVEPDDKICYCYHVSLRKLVNFARREQPRRASQMSECLGAGTGCGWCIPILKKIFAEAASGPEAAAGPALPMSAEDYAEARKGYLKSDRKNSF
jgi:bacterioferritin-associated ferredoxin